MTIEIIEKLLVGNFVVILITQLILAAFIAQAEEENFWSIGRIFNSLEFLFLVFQNKYKSNKLLTALVNINRGLLVFFIVNLVLLFILINNR